MVVLGTILDVALVVSVMCARRGSTRLIAVCFVVPTAGWIALTPVAMILASILLPVFDR